MEKNTIDFTAFDAFHEPLLVFDAGLRLVFVNQLAGRLLPLNPNQWLNKGWSEIFTGQVPGMLKEFLVPGAVPVLTLLWEGLLSLSPTNGQPPRLFQARCSPCVNGGTVNGVLLTLADPPRDRLVEIPPSEAAAPTPGRAAIHHTPVEPPPVEGVPLPPAIGVPDRERDMLRAIVDSIPDHLYLKDRQGLFIAVNQSAVEFTGEADQEEMIGKTDFDHHPPALAQALYDEEQQLMSRGEAIFNQEMSFADPADPARLIWLSVTKLPFRDATGSVAGIVCHNRIITRQKEFELALIEERNLLRTIIEAIPDAIYVKDLESRFVLTNSGCLKQLGAFSEGDVLRKNDQDFFPDENVSAWMAEERAIMETSRSSISRYSFVLDKHLLITKVPLFNAQGQVRGLIGINRDIEALKSLEQELQKRLRLEELVRKVSLQATQTPLADIDRGIYQCLELIGEFEGADHVALLFLKNEPDRVTLAHEWSRAGCISHQDIFPHMTETELALMKECAVSLEPCRYNSDSRPGTGESCGVRWLSRLGVSTLLMVPLALHGSPFGILLLDLVDEEKTWPEDDMALLRVAGEVMVGAVARKHQYDQLALERHLLQTMMDTTPDLFFAKDIASRFLFLNQPEARALGLQRPADALGKTDFDFFPIDSARKFFKLEQTLIQTGNPLINQDELHPDGKVFLTSKVPLKDSNGRIIGLVGTGRDVTERNKIQERIEYISFHDTLTGLYNRAFFEEETQRLDSSRQLPLSVIMIDLNGLKLANDAFGHQTGDRLLQKMAAILQTQCRKEDLVARWGGDEFIILLPQTSPEVSQEVAERILHACREEEEQPIGLSIAIGCATRQDLSENMSQIITAAEERMYRNKFTESRSARHALLSSLERSLRENNQETGDHAHRLRVLVKVIGVKLSLPASDLDNLDLLAQLHDLGKIAVPREILDKPGPLTEQEWATVKKHPEVGYRIAQSSPDLAPIAEGILYHHERWDGSGYPQGISGDNIPLISRILTLADSIDVMLRGRPYQAARSPFETILEIRRERGKQFDPRVVDIFLQLPRTLIEDYLGK